MKTIIDSKGLENSRNSLNVSSINSTNILNRMRLQLNLVIVDYLTC